MKRARASKSRRPEAEVWRRSARTDALVGARVSRREAFYGTSTRADRAPRLSCADAAATKGSAPGTTWIWELHRSIITSTCASTTQRGHVGASWHGSSSTDHRGTGHCSCTHAKNSSPSGSVIVRCSLDRTIHGRPGSCSVIVKPYLRYRDRRTYGRMARGTTPSPMSS